MKNRIVNFSNIYSSSKSKDQNRARSLSPSLGKSPKISHNTLNFKNFKDRPKESISNIPKIDNYRGQAKLTFTQERAAQINKRLEIDSIIQKNFERRVKTNQMFINPNNNPFNRVIVDPFPVSSEVKSQVNIVSEINKLRQSTPAVTIKKRLGRGISPLEQYIIDEQTTRSKMKRKGAEKQRYMPFQTQLQVPDNAYIQSQIEKFEQIIKIRQESFFNVKRSKRPWNIFEIINNKNHQDFKSNKQTLTKFHFSRDSILNIHHSQKKKYENNSLQQISSFSRQILLISHKKIKNLPQRFMINPGDVRVTIQKIQFWDLMPIASSRLTQPVLLRYFREEDLADKEKAQRQENENKKAKEQAGIAYKENSKNRIVNCGNDVQDRTEIKIYEHHAINVPIQAQQERLSNFFKQKYMTLSKEELKSLSQTIRDKQFLQRMKQKKNAVLIKQLQSNADIRINKLMKQVDRKIRMNKVTKNRTQKIKINILTQTLKQRQKMESISPKKSLGKSALLSWR